MTQNPGPATSHLPAVAGLGLLLLAACVTPYSPSAFHKAAERGDVAAVTTMLDHGTDINVKDPYGWSALQYATASMAPQEAMVRLLLSRGADINCSTGGSTPLYLAAIREHVGIARLLIGHGADVDAAMAQLESVMNDRHERGLAALDRARRERVPPSADAGRAPPEVLKAAMEAQARKQAPADPNAETLMLTLVFDAAVPESTRENVRRAAAVCFGLLARYKIPLSFQVTVKVTADEEAYIQALRTFVSKEEADRTGRRTDGTSLRGRNTILVKGTPGLAEDPRAAYRVLPHELFHQVQDQYGKVYPGAWLSEGSAEMFPKAAFEEAGYGRMEEHVRFALERVKRAPSVPDAHMLHGKDPELFKALAGQEYPVYAMSTVMVSRLIEGKDFGKVAAFYRSLGEGTALDTAFEQAFGTTIAAFIDESNTYFASLRR